MLIRNRTSEIKKTEIVFFYFNKAGERMVVNLYMRGGGVGKQGAIKGGE